MNNEKLTIEEFRNYKAELINLKEELDLFEKDNSIIKNNLFVVYYGLQNSLLNYDLSDIPEDEWKDLKILSDRNHIVDLSKTRANIPLDIFENLEYVNLNGCNIKDNRREEILIGDFKINLEDYSLKFISENPDLFLIDVDIPERVKDSFFNRRLTIENFIKYQDIFNKFPIDNFLTPEIEISNKIKDNYPLGEYQKILLKYQNFFEKISYRRDMFLFNEFLVPEENLDKTILKTSKKFITTYLKNRSLDDVLEWSKILNLNLIEDVKTLQDFMNYDINTYSLNISAEALIEYFNIDYLKQLEKDTNIFSKSDFKLFKLLKDYILKKEKDIYANSPLKSYEEFEKVFISYLEKLRKEHIYKDTLDYNLITLNLHNKYPDMFIDEKAPEDLKMLFNEGNITIEKIYKNPNYIEYLKDKNLLEIINSLNDYDLIIKNSSQMLKFPKEYIKRYGNESFLNLCRDYGEFLPKSLKINNIEEFNSKGILAKIIKERVYKKLIDNDLMIFSFSYERLANNLDFVKEFPDIFVNFDINTEENIKELCYEGILTAEHIKKYPVLKNYLKDKKISLFFRENRKNYSLIKKIGENAFLELSEKYGRYLDAIDENDIKKLNIYNIENIIANKCLTGNFEYSEDAPMFLKEKHKEIFLDEKAPKSLKKYFYSINDNYLDFQTLKENYKEWKDYIDNNKIYISLLRNPNIHDAMKTYFEEFGIETGISLGLKNSKSVTAMIDSSDIYLMKVWFEKTGGKYVPDDLVMKKFPKQDIDKFLISGKYWSNLMRLKDYSTTEEKVSALIKASYLFGVFDQDKTGFDNLYSIITNIPKQISYDYKDTMLKVKNDINNKYFSLLKDSLKEENILIDSNDLFRYFYTNNESNNYILNFNKNSCPKTSKIFRSIINKYDELPIMTSNKLEKIFRNFDYNNNEKFRKFFIKNIDLIVSNDDYTSLLSSIEKNFNEIEKVNSNRKLNLNNALSYISNKKYENINPGNEILARTLVIAGYQDKEFEILQQIYNIGRKRTLSSIPRVENTYDDYNYEILRLDDPLALTIGVLTNCCQQLGDKAESCMEHSMTDKNGRIFVVKDKIGNIVAQSWVWRNKDTLCFDNIEIPLNVIKRKQIENINGKEVALEIFGVYKKAAKELIKLDKENYQELLVNKKITEEEYNSLKLKKITVGLGHNDIRKVIEENLNLIKLNDTIRPIEFEPTISKRNLYIADSELQYMLENTKEDSNSSYAKDNLYIYNDKYIEYDDNNFKALNTYQELEKLTKNINYENDDSRNFITNLAYKHRLNSETTRVIINPNFAILYDVNQDKVRIADLLFNTKIVNKNQSIDIEEDVLLQINLALKQIGEDKDIQLVGLDENQRNMYEKAKSLDSRKRK